MSTRIKAVRWATLGCAIAAAVVAAVAPSASASTGSAASSIAGGIRPGPARIVARALDAGQLAGVKSTNWAGYVDKGHAFSAVRAGWIEPRVTCTASDSVASFWVGLDGYTTRSVEQAGTVASCHDGKATHYTWWQMGTSHGAQLVGGTVKPGDKMTASVVVSGSSYTLSVVDHTTPANSFTKKATCSTCRNASAEWIAERPSGSNGLFPLAKFDHLAFFAASVGVGSARGPISKYTHDEITMINHGGAAMARVSGLQNTGHKFVTTWLRMQ